MEDFRLRMGITTSLAPRASASYRGIFLQESGETLRDSEFTLQEVWNSLYDTGVEGSGLTLLAWKNFERGDRVGSMPKSCKPSHPEHLFSTSRKNGTPIQILA